MTEIIEGSALLRYHLDMEDGPLSILSILERKERLRTYNDAWKYFRWSACIELDIGVSAYNINTPSGILILSSKREGKIICADSI